MIMNHKLYTVFGFYINYAVLDKHLYKYFIGLANLNRMGDVLLILYPTSYLSI